MSRTVTTEMSGYSAWEQAMVRRNTTVNEDTDSEPGQGRGSRLADGAGEPPDLMRVVTSAWQSGRASVFSTLFRGTHQHHAFEASGAASGAASGGGGEGQGLERSKSGYDAVAPSHSGDMEVGLGGSKRRTGSVDSGRGAVGVGAAGSLRGSAAAHSARSLPLDSAERLSGAQRKTASTTGAAAVAEKDPTTAVSGSQFSRSRAAVAASLRPSGDEEQRPKDGSRAGPEFTADPSPTTGGGSGGSGGEAGALARSRSETAAVAVVRSRPAGCCVVA